MDWAQLVRSRPARAGSTRVVAVDGPSGAGKTTLAGRIGDALGAPVVHLDDMYPGWDGLAGVLPHVLEWVLEPLAAGRPGGWFRWDWAAGRYAEWHGLPAAAELVLDGVGSGARVLAPYLSLLVWVDAPEPLRFARGMARDGEGYRPHWDRWARQEQAFFAADRPRERADVLFDGGADPETGG